MENVVKADFSDRKACCYCSDYEIRKRRAPLEANALFRSMSVSGTSTMLYHSTNYPKYPVIPTNAWSSSTVADGVSSAVASLASAGRTLCRSITMHTNSKLEQHHLDFGKFTESPPPLQAGENRFHGDKVWLEIRAVIQNVIEISLYSSPFKSPNKSATMLANDGGSIFKQNPYRS